MTNHLERPITDYELSARALGYLEQIGVKTAGDLANLSDETIVSKGRTLPARYRKEIGEMRATILRGEAGPSAEQRELEIRLLTALDAANRLLKQLKDVEPRHDPFRRVWYAVKRLR